MPTLILPHRFRESTFRFYEKYIAQVVLQFPTVLRLNPALVDRSPETFRSRFHDAITSVLEHKWSTTINLADLSAIQNDIRVAQNSDGTLSIGSAEQLKIARGNVAAVQQVEDAKPMPEFNGQDTDLLLAVCVCMSKSFLKGPIKVTNPPDADHMLELENKYDVAAMLEDGKYYILL